MVTVADWIVERGAWLRRWDGRLRGGRQHRCVRGVGSDRGGGDWNCTTSRVASGPRPCKRRDPNPPDFLEWTTARLGPPTFSLRTRLQLQGIAGVALIVGLVAVTAMAVGFTDLLDDVLEGDGLAVVDRPSAGWLAQHRDVWLTRVLIPVTHWGAARPVRRCGWCWCVHWRRRSADPGCRS